MDVDGWLATKNTMNAVAQCLARHVPQDLQQPSWMIFDNDHGGSSHKNQHWLLQECLIHGHGAFINV